MVPIESCIILFKQIKVVVIRIHQLYTYMPDCGTKYSIDHGYADFIGKTTTFNNTVPIVCDAGYDLIGDPYTTCQPDGTWSQNTVCKIKGKPNLFIKYKHFIVDFVQKLH